MNTRIDIQRSITHRRASAFATLFFTLVAFALLFSCNSHKPEFGSLAGNVQLVNDTGYPANDPGDFSGVTVALYKLAELDTTLVRINQKYPEIGVSVSQETEFDHRKEDPMKHSVTDAAGVFTLNDIEVGTYNLVFLKQGWGQLYILEFEVEQGDNDLKKASNYHSARSLDKSLITKVQPPIHKGSVTLYPTRQVPALVSNNITFAQGRTYLITTDTTVLGTATVEAGSVIAVAPNTRLNFQGAVTTSNDGGWWRLTSSHNIDLIADIDSIMPYNSVGVLNPNNNVSISGMIMDSAVEGIKIAGSSLQLSYSILKNTSSMALLVQTTQCNISNIMMTGNGLRGIHSLMNSITVEESVFYANRDPLQLLVTVGNVNNNYFCENLFGVRPIIGTVSITHNCFDRNSSAVSPSASEIEIEYNEFYANDIDIELNGFYEDGIGVISCIPSAENNNFFGNGIYVHCFGTNSYYADGAHNFPGISSDHIFPNNYLVAPDLLMHVVDHNYPGMATFSYTVSFNPRRGSRVSNAGII